jgi:predicted glycosyltransferase
MSNRTGPGREHSRVLIYSHDTFGLGHLRRCRTIAHALVERHKDLSVLILSGSPIIGSFDFRSRVDFVRIPGVIKLRDGEYTSLNLHIDIEEMLAMRASIIRHTADIFDPDLFIVDKEPLGLRGEVLETLQLLKSRGTPLVLGLRDVMDEVYGLPQICDPLEGVKVPLSVRRKMVYTGYLERSAPVNAGVPEMPEDPFILVTPGGGGDGEDMVDWVLRAYENDPNLPHRALIVLGPFMNRDLQNEFLTRASALPRVEALTFESQLESLMSKAAGVVAMGGYNTFCEILSFDKKALIVPRVVPRLEQFIRASRAHELGLVSMLPDDGVRYTNAMATALRQLPQQQAPSDVVIPGLLDGLENVNRLAERHLSEPRRPARRPMFRKRA